MPRRPTPPTLPAPPDTEDTRKPYSPPKLRYLGTVRDLTLGTTATGPADSKGVRGGRKGHP